VKKGDSNFHTLKFLVGCYEKAEKWDEIIDLLTSLPLQTYLPKEAAALHLGAWPGG
jgi:hypothetical protein